VRKSDDLWAQALQQLSADEQATLRDAAVGVEHPKSSPTVAEATTMLAPLSATDSMAARGVRARCPEPEQLCATAATKRDKCDKALAF
jgi:hypothetical protein